MVRIRFNPKCQYTREKSVLQFLVSTAVIYMLLSGANCPTLSFSI